MIKLVIALVSTALLSLPSPLLAAPHAGGAAFAPSGGAAGPGYGAGRPGWGGSYVGARPGHGGHPGYGGWHGGYWGPRIGFYYGGPGYWGGWPGAWAAWPFAWDAAYAYGYSAAPMIVYDTAQPQSFIQQEPPAGVAAQAAPEASYWYYCTQPAGYFPYVKDCSQAWLKVVPQAPGQQATAPRVAP